MGCGLSPRWSDLKRHWTNLFLGPTWFIFIFMKNNGGENAATLALTSNSQTKTTLMVLRITAVMKFCSSTYQNGCLILRLQWNLPQVLRCFFFFLNASCTLDKWLLWQILQAAAVKCEDWLGWIIKKNKNEFIKKKLGFILERRLASEAALTNGLTEPTSH